MPNRVAGVTMNPLFQSIGSSDQYRYEGLPPELAAEEQAVNRRQQIANYLAQQGLGEASANHGQMVGRFYVPGSWAQNAAGLGKILAGGVGNYMADQQRGDIAKRGNQMLVDAMEQYRKATAPTITEGPRPTAQVMPPAPNLGPHAGLMPQPTPPPVTKELYGPGAPVSAPRTPEERQQALVDLMMSKHPLAQRAGAVLEKQFADAQERGLQRDWLTQQKEADRENRLATTQAQMGQNVVLATLAGASKAQIEEMKANNAKAIEQMRSDSRENVANIAANSRETVAGMKAGKTAEDKETGQKNVQMLTAQLHDYYDQLHQHGGITSTEKGTVENIGARIGSSPVGQIFGGAVGTKNQSIRDSIAQQRPLLMQAIMKATGMTAKQMDSNVELKLWLATATDPTLGYEANKRALGMLEKLYGGGEAAAPETPVPSKTPAAPTGPTTVRKYNPATGKIE